MVMNRRGLFSITVAALVTCAGCDLFAPGVHYGDDLNFAIREGSFVNPPPPPPQIALIVETTKVYPCLNYSLEGELHVADHLLRVLVTENVHAPEEICLTAIGSAQYRAVLPVTVGRYTLEFVRNGVTDLYAVTISDSAILITPQRSSFTHPSAGQFPRGS